MKNSVEVIKKTIILSPVTFATWTPMKRFEQKLPMRFIAKTAHNVHFTQFCVCLHDYVVFCSRGVATIHIFS